MQHIFRVKRRKSESARKELRCSVDNLTYCWSFVPVLARPHNLVPREPFSFRRKTLVTRLLSPLTESLDTDAVKILKLKLKDSGKKKSNIYFADLPDLVCSLLWPVV